MDTSAGAIAGALANNNVQSSINRRSAADFLIEKYFGELSLNFLEEISENDMRSLARMHNRSENNIGEFDGTGVVTQLDEKNDVKNINDIIEFIRECQEQGKPITGRIGNVFFAVDKNNLQKITFRSKYGNYLIVIDGYDNPPQSQVEFLRRDGVCFCKNKEYIESNLVLVRSITVINGKDIVESYYVDYVTDEQGNRIPEIVKYIVDNSDGKFELREKDSAIFRQIKDPNEQITSIINSPLLYPRKIRDPRNLNTETGFHANNPKPDKLKTYGEYTLIAQQIEQNCEHMYLLIMSAFDIVREQSTGIVSARLRQSTTGFGDEQKENSCQWGRGILTAVLCNVKCGFMKTLSHCKCFMWTKNRLTTSIKCNKIYKIF